MSYRPARLKRQCSHTTRTEREMTSSVEHESTVIFKNNLRSRCLWALPLILKRNKPNPKRGSRATGAGCAVQSSGHPSCSVAMAASGSGSKPHKPPPSNRNQGHDRMLYKQPLFALGDEAKGPAYLRRAGETLKVLIEDEREEQSNSHLGLVARRPVTCYQHNGQPSEFTWCY